MQKFRKYLISERTRHAQDQLQNGTKETSRVYGNASESRLSAFMDTHPAGVVRENIMHQAVRGASPFIQ